MSSTEEIYDFCIFCYRKYLFLKPARHKDKLKLFVKLLERFICSKTVLFSHFNQLNALDYSLLGCCGDCWLTVDGFCEIYHQFKCFELQLEWKIDRLFNVIQLANKVPSRISELEKTLHNVVHREDNPDAITEVEKLKHIKSFRHLISKHCRRKLARSHPKVILEKNDSLFLTSTLGFKEIEIPIKKATLVDCLRQDSQPQITKQEPNLSCDDNAIIEDNCREVTNVRCTDAPFESHNLEDSLTSYENPDDDDFRNDTNDNTEQNSINTEKFVDSEMISQDEEIPAPDPPSPITTHNTVLSTFQEESNTANNLCCSPNFSNINDSNVQINLKFESESEDVILQKGYKVDQQSKQDNTNYTASNFDNDTATAIDKNTFMPTSPVENQRRYKLRQRQAKVSIKLEVVTDDLSENKSHYSINQSSSYLSSSATSESEDDKEVPMKKKKLKLKQSQKPQRSACKICNRKVLHNKRHFRTNHNKAGMKESQIFKCKKQSCPAYFLRLDQLKLHCVQEHKETYRKTNLKRKTIFRCVFCREVFPTHRQLSHHKSKCNPIDILAPTPTNPDIKKSTINDFTCNFCDHSTNSPSNLAIHETNHASTLHEEPNSKTRQCPRCPYKYIFKRRYILHHLRHHLKLLSGKSPGACTLCSSEKIYVENNKTHYDVHHNTDLLDDPTKIFKCDECPAYYVQSFQLHRHKIRVHPNYTCAECGKVLKMKHCLDNHMKKIHQFDEESAELPVSCNWPECKKRFASEGEMDFHIRYTHKRKREDKRIRSELCPKCGKAFKSSGVLKYHMRTAHVEKSYICSQCGKRFRDATTLKVHMEYHKSPDEWKFECKECGKKCVDKEKLEQHLRTHTKEKPWVCQFCGEKYAHRHNWKNHLKTKHGDEKGVQEGVSRKKTGSFLSRKGSQKGDCILAGAKL